LAGYSNVTVETVTPAYGGAEREDVESIRFSAPKSFQAQKRAITLEDYKTLLKRDFPSIDSLAVWGGENEQPPQYGKVFISIKPVAGYFITDTVKATIVNDILKKYNVVSVLPVIQDPEYIYVKINSTVKYNANATTRTANQIMTLVLNAISNFGTTDVGSFDRILRYSKLVRAIDLVEVSITNNLTTLQIQKQFEPRLNVADQYTIQFGNAIEPWTLTSNAFVEPDISYVNGEQYFLDDNGNGQWDAGDIYINSFGHSGDLPVVGSWRGNGLSNIGTFTPTTGTWQLDTNGDGVLDCAVDSCGSSFGKPGDFPVTREMGGTTGTVIGTYTPESIVKINGRNKIKRGRWQFDINDNSAFDGCSIDQCDTFNAVGEMPVIGDWNGTGTEEIALFVGKNGTWFLDRNANEKWDGCTKDKCLGQFGTKGDLPIAGDWDGTGKVRIGVFRPSTSMWYLDLNGNGKLDACGVDACIGPFGQPGDLPVVGKW
jgi:hypothetical protein